MARARFDDPQYYLNRHLQCLDFNRRVLEEANESGNPLLRWVTGLTPTPGTRSLIKL